MYLYDNQSWYVATAVLHVVLWHSVTFTYWYVLGREIIGIFSFFYISNLKYHAPWWIMPYIWEKSVRAKNVWETWNNLIRKWAKSSKIKDLHAKPASFPWKPSQLKQNYWNSFIFPYYVEDVQINKILYMFHMGKICQAIKRYLYRR